MIDQATQKRINRALQAKALRRGVVLITIPDYGVCLFDPHTGKTHSCAGDLTLFDELDRFPIVNEFDYIESTGLRKMIGMVLAGEKTQSNLGEILRARQA